MTSALSTGYYALFFSPTSQQRRTLPLFLSLSLMHVTLLCPVYTRGAMSTVKFEAFKQLDIRVGKVLSAERVKRSEKLILLRVDIGGEERQIVAGLAPHYTPEQLVGKSVVVVVNLEPKTIMGVYLAGYAPCSC